MCGFYLEGYLWNFTAIFLRKWFRKIIQGGGALL